MKQLLRAASIGFGGVLGAGAAVALFGALAALGTRTAASKAVDDLLDRLFEKAPASPDQTHPASEQS